MAVHLPENLGNCNYYSSTTSILDIPGDSIYVIFQKLDSRSDHDSFGLTCRNWLMVQNSSRLSLVFNCSCTAPSILSEPKDIPRITSYKIHTLLTRFRNLKELSLWGMGGSSNSDLSQLSLCGSTLRSLYLFNCFGINDSGVMNIGLGCPFLTIISLSQTDVTDIGLLTLSKCCPSLKVVNLSHCYFITDRGIQYLTVSCRGLRSLDISNCGKITGIGFKDCSATLTSVKAEFSNLTAEGIMEIVSGLVELQYVNLSFLRNVDGLAAVGIGLASRLRVLDLMMCRLVGDEMVKVIAKGCCLLQEWRLAYCLQIGIPGWKSIGLNCRNLERLHVYRCTGLCEVGLEYLRDGCVRLSVLYTGTPLSRLSLLARQIFESRRPEVELSHHQMVDIFPVIISHF